MTTSANPRLKAGDRLGAYTVQRVTPLNEIQSTFYGLEHPGTGAQHIHIANDDPENTFSVAFKTVPTDATGVAHILEHTVLCGSKKYPVRDPFFSMLKRSLSTFMNAFTASDWTMYPFSTQNRKDFYNLMDVYLDATFFPDLKALNFKQEGHRLEFEPAGDGEETLQLTYKGVVYNEMKGAMSSPDQVMVRSTLNAIYPETTYRHNSGGDPVVIPTLTHDQLRAFHQRHYHPSNAFFYTYGNLPLEEHLAVIQATVLDHFDRIDPQTEVSAQPRWKTPRQTTYTYPLDPSERPDQKCQVSLAWLTADIRETFDVFVFKLLEQILLGNDASPLRKALIESGLGSALSDGSGYDGENRDTLFTCGLKEARESSADRIESLILDTLSGLVRDGIPPDLIEAAVHQIEFHRREITNTPYPFGLKLLLTLSGSWFHGGRPDRTLQVDEDLQRLRQELGRGRFFEKLIQTHLLDNPHRVRITLVPDPEHAAKEHQRVTQELAEIQAKLNPIDIETIQQDQNALQALQESAEDISCLPTLSRDDIPRTVHRVIPTNVMTAPALTEYRQPTSGIFYLSAVAGAGVIPSDLLPLVPFWCFALPKMGTRRRDYVAMAQRIDLYTGGIGFTMQARTRYGDGGGSLPLIAVNGKALARNLQPLFDIVGELLVEHDFGNLERLQNLLLEYRAHLEAMVIHNGHRLAIALASRQFAASAALNEIWTGVHQLKAIKDLTQDLSEASLKDVVQRLHQLGRTVFNRQNFNMATIGEAAIMPEAIDLAQRLCAQLPPGDAGEQATAGFTSPPDIPLGQALPREGWTTSTAVSFVAQSFQTVSLEHPDAPALAVISKMLRSMYLHREIREKGGAYGGFALYNPEDGIFALGSYRDPHIANTLNVYRAAGDFIVSDDYIEEDIKEAILQVCSEIDKPNPPGPAAIKAFHRTVVGLSDEARLQFKRQLLALDRGSVQRTAEKYFGASNRASGVAVISNHEALQAANRHLDPHPLALHQI